MKRFLQEEIVLDKIAVDSNVRSSIESAVWLVPALALAVALGHLAWYANSPLGRWPLLDAREILDLAHAIAGHALPPEAFYRAPGYSALLAMFERLGVGAGALADVGRLVNLAAHLGSSVAVVVLARAVGAPKIASVLAGAAWCAYPIALHLAGEPLDITLGTALALWAIVLIAQPGRRRPMRDVAGAALLAGACLVRPNFVAVAVALVIWRAISARWSAWSTGIAAVPPLAGLVAALATLGAVNFSIAGEFRVLPWQGSYALWSANRPESNGRYYEQIVQVRSDAGHLNPARVESVVLYAQETGDAPPHDYREVHAHWREKFGDRVRDHPFEVASLLIKKSYFLFNNQEQYDNRTYSFHKAESPWLRWNPLCWSVVIALAAGGMLALRRSGVSRDSPAVALIVVAVVYAGSTLLFFVSDRFRLPLAALLMPLAAVGASALFSGARRVPIFLAVIATGVLSVLPTPDPRHDATIPNDLLLLAQASLNIGREAEAENYARAAIAKVPARSAGWEILCLARYTRTYREFGAKRDDDSEAESLRACFAPAQVSPRARELGAIFLWRANRKAEALELWRGGGVANSVEAAMFLAALGEVPPPNPLAGQPLQVLIGHAARGDPGARASLENVLGRESAAAEVRRLRGLLGL